MSNPQYPSPPPYQPQPPTAQPHYVQPHPQSWQQPGPGYVLPQHPYGHGYPPPPQYGPPQPERATGGRIAMFSVAASLSGISWLFGLFALVGGFSSGGDSTAGMILLLVAAVSVGGSAFFIYRAVKTKFRYLWSIMLLVLNVVLPILFFILIFGLLLLLFAGAASVGTFA